MATSTDGAGTAPEAASPAGSVRPAADDTPLPAVALLSNGRYGVMITAAGAGSSTWRGLDVTRWREDATRDCWGQFCYVRDLGDGTVWSAGYQPLCRAADEYEVAFHADRAEFRRRDGDVETRLAVCVAPDHDAEVRVVTLVNHGDRPREFDLTSYAEVCLNPAAPTRPTRPSRSCSWRRSSSRHPAPCWPAAGRGPRTRSRSGPSTSRRLDDAAERRIGVRDRPGTVPGPRPDAGQPRGPGPRGPPVRDDRPGAGPGLQPAAAGPPRPGAPGQRRVRHRSGRDPGGGDRPRPNSSGTSRPLTGRSPAPGRLPGRAAGARPDAGRRCPVQPTGGAGRLHRPALRQPDAVAANRLGQPGLWPHAISGDRPIVLARVAAARRRVAGPPARAVARLRPPPRPGPGPRHPGRAPRRRRRPAQGRPPGRRRRPAARQAGRGVRPGRGQGPRRRRECSSRPRPGPSSAADAARWPSSSTADQPRQPSPPPPIDQRPGRDRARAAGRHAARGSDVLERPRRVHAGRPRVRDRHRRHRPGGRPCRRPRGPTCSPTPASAAW